ncbi:phosphoglycerate mutase GpmB [Bacillus sp. T2.9-1]|uniref:histidine phosphatase family protein n=1 Tax=Bacillus sp. T2.9-1 TaxID=3041163 RepID=UPI002477B77C|nr:histidine phosphatase family protein [Bacillus sp. T2.9-1]CAI9386842.1 phosphoglycerate mutase GpmB [Bacillus sp. T2.9-1]
MDNELRLYFIRHGETQYNIEKRMQGFCDSPLTENGILQAKSVGAGLVDISFVAAYASDSQRVLDTAKYALGTRKIQLTKDVRLKEMNFGMFEAMLQADIISEHGDILDRLFSFKDVESKVQDGESFTDLINRTKAAVDDIIAAHKDTGGNIAVFSHGVTIGFLMKSLLNSEGFPHHDNCCVSVILVKDGQMIVEKVADASFRDSGKVSLSIEK